MPRRNKKNYKGRTAGVESNSEDDSCNDNTSVYSCLSDNASSSVNDSEELTTNERYEDRLVQAIENASEKSAPTRVTALQNVCEILMHRYMPEFVDDRKITLLDCIEKSIRRGKSAEQICAISIAPLLVLQLNGDETVIKNLNQLLQCTVQDKAVSFDARAKCCSSLGLLNFLSNDDISDVLNIMQMLETIFSGSFLKGDDKVTVSVSAEAGILHSAALEAWALLLTLLPSGDLVNWMTNSQVLPSMKKLMGLLQSPHLEVRTAAGETLALILECGRAHTEDFLEDDLSDLVFAVKQLATDSHKYRAKRVRKTQRATFRDVLHYLEEDISPEITIHFGAECLLLDSWAIHHQYSTLCAVMGPGMSFQLRENEFVRDIFGLGPKISPTNSSTKTKTSKLERHLINAAAFKARTITRNKNRDKRSAMAL